MHLGFGVMCVSMFTCQCAMYTQRLYVRFILFIPVCFRVKGGRTSSPCLDIEQPRCQGCKDALEPPSLWPILDKDLTKEMAPW